MIYLIPILEFYISLAFIRYFKKWVRTLIEVSVSKMMDTMEKLNVRFWHKADVQRLILSKIQYQVEFIPYFS